MWSIAEWGGLSSALWLREVQKCTKGILNLALNPPASIISIYDCKVCISRRCLWPIHRANQKIVLIQGGFCPKTDKFCRILSQILRTISSFLKELWSSGAQWVLWEYGMQKTWVWEHPRLSPLEQVLAIKQDSILIYCPLSLFDQSCTVILRYFRACCWWLLEGSYPYSSHLI